MTLLWIVVAFIGAVIGETLEWILSLFRRRPNGKLVLYQFRDRTPHSRSEQTWHLVGDANAIETFIPRRELRALMTVTWTGTDGQLKYAGVYKKRMVSKFRRHLREKGADLEVRLERPAFTSDDSRRFHFHGAAGK